MSIRVAILDMYKDKPNLGLSAIRKIVGENFGLQFDEYNVRSKIEIPDTSYDVYIFSGGPGDPLECSGGWDVPFFSLIDDLWEHNSNSDVQKFAFFICHSFQLICNHFKLGEVISRRSESFGVFPVHKTEAGKRDAVFARLPAPFYAADFRSFQVIQPNKENFLVLGAELLALEKIRPHVDLERAMMAIRISDAWMATQFHPEADPEGMRHHFTLPERKKYVLEQKGTAKYAEMIAFIQDPKKLQVTFETCLPTFIRNAISYYEKLYPVI